MRKVRNIIFLICCGTLLCGTVLCTVADRVGFEFPEEFSVNPGESSLEGREYTMLPGFSLPSFVGGSFQVEAENYVADLVPVRDEIMLTNAWIQRELIELSAALFSFSEYPTYLNSSYIYSEETEALYSEPLSQEDVHFEDLAQLAASLNSVIEEHSETDYYFAITNRSGTLSIDPFDKLVSNPFTYDDLSEGFFSLIEEPVTSVDLSTGSIEEFNAFYYGTDHHWTALGVYDGYVKIASALGFGGDLLQTGELTMYDQYEFYGSYSRQGLYADIEPDFVCDYAYVLPEYEIVYEGEVRDASFLKDSEKYESGLASDDQFTDRHAEFFHTSCDLILRNLENPNLGTIIIVGDSYTSQMERLFVAHYTNVYVYDPRRSEVTLSEAINQCSEDLEAVVFLMCYETMYSDGMLEFVS